MRLEARHVFPPVIALLILFLVLRQTLSALRSSGSWQARPRTTATVEDPYARLDRVLSRPLLPTVGVRDPFGYGPVSTGPVTVRTVGGTPRPVIPVPPPAPVLTSIIFDADPRATIRYIDRDFSVRENSLFADFRVRSITSTQVVLERNGEPLVLTLRPKGE